MSHRFAPRRLALGLALLVTVGAAPAATLLPADATGQPIATLAPMLERITPAVVNVNSKTRVRVRDPFADDPFFRHFFGMPNMPRERVQQSLGSGVIVDAQRGYVLTNNHVIDGADDISVTLSDGRTLKAEKVGNDPDSDVAVIRIPAENLPSALILADSSKLRVGDFVVAVGNPFGIGQSATFGMVSALDRSNLRGVGVQSFIQTDASINPGNSGGALVNLRGELIGINSMIYSPSGGNVGLGFAIPANLAGDVMRQLIAFGEVKRGSLGVQTQDLDEEIAPMLGLQPGRGAVVTRVNLNTPAAQAGLKPGDVITAINGHAVNNRAELASIEGQLPVGAKVELTITREGKPLTVSTVLKLIELRQNTGARIDPRLTGVTLSDSGDKFERLGLNGAVVAKLDADSRAAQSGLAAGDLITAVNQRDIDDLAGLEAVAGQHPRQLLLTVVRGRSAFYLMLE